MANEDKISLGFVETRKETNRAIYVEDVDSKCFWVPKSVLHDDSEVWKKDQEGNLVVFEWWAEKNNFI